MSGYRAGHLALTALTTCNAGDCPEPMAAGQDVPGEPGYCLEHLEEVVLNNTRQG